MFKLHHQETQALMGFLPAGSGWKTEKQKAVLFDFFEMVQNLWDRNRISCMPVAMVLHLILLLQIKSDEKYAGEEPF